MAERDIVEQQPQQKGLSITTQTVLVVTFISALFVVGYFVAAAEPAPRSRRK